MYARVFNARLKPEKASAYPTFLDQEVLPNFRKFSGFRDQMTMISPDGYLTVTVSLWNTPEEEQLYSQKGYQDILKSLEPFLAEEPVVENYGVAVSTAHSIKPPAAGAGGR